MSVYQREMNGGVCGIFLTEVNYMYSTPLYISYLCEYSYLASNVPRQNVCILPVTGPTVTWHSATLILFVRINQSVFKSAGSSVTACISSDKLTLQFLLCSSQ